MSVAWSVCCVAHCASVGVCALNHLCEQKELLSLFLAALWLLTIDDSENVNAFVAAGGLEVCMDVLKAPPGPSMDHAQYTVLGMNACCHHYAPALPSYHHLLRPLTTTTLLPTTIRHLASSCLCAARSHECDGRDTTSPRACQRARLQPHVVSASEGARRWLPA